MLAAVPASSALAASAEVYRWVDENGVVHYRVERTAERGPERTRLRPPGAVAPPGAVPPAAPPVPQASAPELPTEAPVAGTPPPEPTARAETPSIELAPPLSEAEAVDDETEEAAELPERGAPGRKAAGAGPSLVGTREIAELEAQIARDRETLKSLISESALHGRDVSDDPRVREISDRLPRLQSELEALRAEAAPSGDH
jgi:hypothetical protein